MKSLVERKARTPKDFKARPAEPGTSAYEYLRGRRRPHLLLDDPELMWIVNDKHPDGGLIYVFKDHSSVVWRPVLQ